jgi:hypothetical protein
MLGGDPCGRPSSFPVSGMSRNNIRPSPDAPKGPLPTSTPPASLHFIFLDYTTYTPLNAEKPPSTGTTIPVTNADAGLTSHNSVPTKSSGAPKRAIGV